MNQHFLSVLSTACADFFVDNNSSSQQPKLINNTILNNKLKSIMNTTNTNTIVTSQRAMQENNVSGLFSESEMDDLMPDIERVACEARDHPPSSPQFYISEQEDDNQKEEEKDVEIIQTNIPTMNSAMTLENNNSNSNNNNNKISGFDQNGELDGSQLPWLKSITTVSTSSTMTKPTTTITTTSSNSSSSPSYTAKKTWYKKRKNETNEELIDEFIAATESPRNESLTTTITSSSSSVTNKKYFNKRGDGTDHNTNIEYLESANSEQVHLPWMQTPFSTNNNSNNTNFQTSPRNSNNASSTSSNKTSKVKKRKICTIEQEQRRKKRAFKDKKAKENARVAIENGQPTAPSIKNLLVHCTLRHIAPLDANEDCVREVKSKNTNMTFKLREFFQMWKTAESIGTSEEVTKKKSIQDGFYTRDRLLVKLCIQPFMIIVSKMDGEGTAMMYTHGKFRCTGTASTDEARNVIMRIVQKIQHYYPNQYNDVQLVDFQSSCQFMNGHVGHKIDLNAFIAKFNGKSATKNGITTTVNISDDQNSKFAGLSVSVTDKYMDINNIEQKDEYTILMWHSGCIFVNCTMDPTKLAGFYRRACNMISQCKYIIP